MLFSKLQERLKLQDDLSSDEVDAYARVLEEIAGAIDTAIERIKADDRFFINSNARRQRSRITRFFYGVLSR